MQNIFKNWQNFINEITGHNEIEVLIRVEADAKIYGDILEKIRAVPGITIVKTSQKLRKISDREKVTVLNIKFFIKETPMAHYADFLRTSLKNIKDEEGDRILGMRFISAPKEV